MVELISMNIMRMDAITTRMPEKEKYERNVYVSI